MKIDPRLFMKALGSGLNDDPYEGHHSRPLRCRCPLHAGEDTMTVMYSPDGNMVFKCSDPTCKFNGDSISLICAKYRVSISAAVGMLCPGGMLASCLVEPMTQVEAEAYTGKANTQLKVKAYLSRCRQLLARNPAKCKLRAGLDVTTLNLIPPEIGLLEIGDDMPPAFNEYRKSKYRKANLITFPFTYNGDVMHVMVVNADNFADRADISIVRPDYGIFCEEALLAKDNRRILATTDPVAAATYYGTLQKNMARRPPIVSISGFPLPHTFSGVSDIDLIEFSDSRISIDYLLESMESDDFVEGGELQPQISVYPYSVMSLDATIGVYNQTNMAVNNDRYGIPPFTAIARKMDDLVMSGKRDDVLEMFRRHSISNGNREGILDAVRSLGEEKAVDYCAIVGCNDSIGSRKLVLGNRKILRSNAKSIECEGRNLDVDVLSNFGMQVLRRVRGYDGDDYLVCSITPDDKNTQPVVVELPESSWQSSGRMRRIISRAFATHGATPYIAMYDIPGVSWYDVISKLSEGCKMQKEITRLGVDEIRDIYFPNIVINTRINDLGPVDDTLRIPDHVLERYGGLVDSPIADYIGPVKTLLEKDTSLGVASFVAGISHILYRTAYLARYGRRPAHGRRHLLFVETEDGCFSRTIDNLNAVFSDDGCVEISSGAPVKSLSRFDQLGSLPLICMIPRVENVQRLVNALTDAPFDVIATVDSYTASLLNGRVSAAYVTPSSEANNTYAIRSGTIGAIRDSFARLLLHMTQHYVANDTFEKTESAVIGYRMLCRLAGCPDTGSVKNIVSYMFAGAGMSGVDSFFQKLHFGISGMDTRMRLCVIHGAPQADHSFTKRGQHIFVMENTVLIGKYVVDLVNKYSRNVFSISQLDEELNERELLVSMPEELEIDPSRCWCIHRDVYEDRIVGKPLMLDKINQ